jgi:hypothetical protein
LYNRIVTRECPALHQSFKQVIFGIAIGAIGIHAAGKLLTASQFARRTTGQADVRIFYTLSMHASTQLIVAYTATRRFENCITNPDSRIHTGKFTAMQFTVRVSTGGMHRSRADVIANQSPFSHFARTQTRACGIEIAKYLSVRIRMAYRKRQGCAPSALTLANLYEEYCMKHSTRIFRQAMLACSVSLLAGAAHALPSLQLGPTVGGGDWSYNTTTDTWDYVGSSDSTAYLSAFANATQEDGGNGDYAWETAGAANQYAYLVVAGVPDLGDIGDMFDITVTGATFFDSGYGNPPLEDPNSLPSHGIYDTYFEIYQFQFNGPIVDIENTEPPGGDPGKGYQEDFAITINSILAGVTGLHFDLYTTIGNGIYKPKQEADRFLVNANAPFSHDAEWIPDDPDDPDPPDVPVPGTALLLGLGLLALRLAHRKAR